MRKFWWKLKRAHLKSLLDNCAEGGLAYTSGWYQVARRLYDVETEMIKRGYIISADRTVMMTVEGVKKDGIN